MKNLITCLVVCVLSGVTFADTWTVDDDGKADFDNIQAAVDAASDGDEIIVMPGTYTSTGDEVVDMLGKSIWLHSSDGPSVTIIDCENARRGIWCNNNETATMIIEGITITRGFVYGEDGGGILCYGVLTITNCFFDSNESKRIYNPPDTYGGRGGGVYLNSNATLTNCTFTNNIAYLGGGALTGGNLTNCTFTGNTATHAGGGMYCWSDSTLTDCTFTNNTAGYGGGGGMYLTSYVDYVLDNCHFDGNTANNGDGGGGGIYFFSGYATLMNSMVQNNVSGGIYIKNFADLTLTNSMVCGNYSYQIDGYWQDGGGNTVANTCVFYGACCTGNNTVCVISDEVGCVNFGGKWNGENTTCNDASCPTECLGDINGDGQVDVNDLLILIAVWGTCP